MFPGFASLMAAKRGTGPVGIGTQTDSDNFNRANQDPIAGNWTADGGGAGTGFRIVSNTAQVAQTGSDFNTFWNIWSHGNDHYSQAEISTAGSDSQAGYGVVVRRSTAIGTQTMYRAVINAAGAIDVGRFITGSFTQIGTRSVAYVAGTKLGMAIQGTSITIWYGGVQQGAAITDNNIATGSPGLGYSGSGGTSGSLDNWDAGTVP